MYQELIEHLKKRAISTTPALRDDEELDAKLTHWLTTDLDDFFGEEISQILRDERVNYSATQGQANLPLTNEIPFINVDGNFDFIDLFAGIGGFNLALTSHGGRGIFACEWDKAAKHTYYKNYGKVPFGDINKFTSETIPDEELDNKIPDHDVLAAGFPCQPFSHAGVSARTSLGLAHGFDCETQGTLFHSIARIAFVKQPKVVFMENVKNIVSHNQGETFSIIKNTMENLGEASCDKHSYRFFYKLINSETLVPQRRVRCFMVCVRDDVHEQFGDFEFPEFDGESIPLRNALEELSQEEIEEYTISDRLWQGHINRTKRNIDRGTGFTAHVADLDRPSNTIVARYGKDGKECLIPQEGSNPRKLTKQECANLFGYPRNFWIPESKTPAYKQFGNSVVVPVVSKISGAIRNQYLTGN